MLGSFGILSRSSLKIKGPVSSMVVNFLHLFFEIGACFSLLRIFCTLKICYNLLNYNMVSMF